MPALADPPLLHRDGALLVVDKPSGLLCQPGRGPALADSLLTRLRRRWPAAQLVHRLDRDTSGLLLLALAPELHSALSRLFAERRVAKHYIADVEGVPAAVSGTIRLALARRCPQPPLYGPDPAGKPCHTAWRLQQAHGDWSRLELRPRTGRSHQLRAHLAAIGHPILGDPLYGQGAGPRLRLHATRLAFLDPRDGRRRIFASPCPF